MHVRNLLLAGTIAGVAMAGTAPAKTTKTTTTTDTTTVTQPASAANVDDLQRQVQAMEAQVSYMKRQIELMQQQVPAKPDPTAAKASLAGGRPSFTSNDGNFKFNISARSHTDYANYFGQPRGLALDNGFNQRRAYITLNGTFYRDWDATIEADFGNSGNENKATGYLRTGQLTWNGKNSGLGNFKATVGYMEPNFDFERGMSSNNLYLMERSTPEQVAASNFGADDRRAAVGMTDNGDNWFGALYYTGSRTGIGNSASIPTSATTTCTSATPPVCSTTLVQQRATNEGSQILGRLSFVPYMDDDTLIHVGVDGMYVLSPDEFSNTTPHRGFNLGFTTGIRVDTTNLISTGAIPANSGAVIAGELGGEWRNFSAWGEWFHFMVDTVNPAAGVGSPTLEFDGGDINFGYVLTGESRGYDKGAGSFGAVKPAHNFDPATGNWGAWELVARFEQTNLNDRESGYLVEGGRLTEYEFGVNWYLNPNIRFMLNYIYADVRRAAIAGSGTAAHLVAPGLGTNLQPAVNVIGVRSQISF